MSKIVKIYSDDPLVHYAQTKLPPETTRNQINGILAEYGVKKVAWNFDIPREVWVLFDDEETIQGFPIRVPVKVPCPTIWNRANPRAHSPDKKVENIDWKVSLRVMYWFIKTHLETGYAMQSGKAIAFLAYIKSANGQQVKDFFLPELAKYKALTEEPI